MNEIRSFRGKCQGLLFLGVVVVGLVLTEVLGLFSTVADSA
jgi:hypothetical protein